MENNIEVKEVKYTVKDFVSDQDVRWCPGCGDYSILAQVQRTFAEIINKPKENIVWVSGIGCSSRFPYYMNTYGFHGIHGRATAIATGIKIANPNLDVWVATGDGDLLSIGGNHFIHTCRKNLNIKIILFNNRIYGLTKGQYSPTSLKGHVTKTSPYGSVEYAFNPIKLALGAEATFIARSIDRNPKHLQEMIKRAAYHKGISLLEVYQNCNIFNDGAFENLTNKETKDDSVIELKHGEPLIFGKNKDKGIKIDGFTPVIVNLNSSEYSINDLWIHDEFDPSPARSSIIISFDERDGFPTPIGVFRQILKETYEDAIVRQINEVTEKKGKGDLQNILTGKNTWKIE